MRAVQLLTAVLSAVTSGHNFPEWESDLDWTQNIQLSAQCGSPVSGRDEIVVTLFTDEPFGGAVYSRDQHECRTDGNGRSKATQLVVQGIECGVKNVTVSRTGLTPSAKVTARQKKIKTIPFASERAPQRGIGTFALFHFAFRHLL